MISEMLQENNMYVAGAEIVRVNTFEQVMEAMNRGFGMRKVSKTGT